MATKLCNKCKTTKPTTEFSKRGLGFQAWCKSCMSSHNKKWMKDNVETVSPARKARARKYKYGLDEEAYEAMLKKQGGHCAICKQNKPTMVDHDHKCCPGRKTCGKCVRSLLCSRCNTFVGYLEKNKSLLRPALKYIGV